MRRTPSPRIHIRTNTDDTWKTQAACSPTTAELFFPASYDDAPGIFHIAAAKTICSNCPVESRCLYDALAEEGTLSAEARNGILGGLTPYERAELAGVTTGRKHHQTRRQVTA
jgi:Transcription factor WhiB